MSDSAFPLSAPNGLDLADRATINHANAQHSTGPRTEDGKRRSSLNTLRHGLTGQTIVLPSEDLAAYERHTRRFTDDLQPKGAIEDQLVQSLADAAWRLNRVAALENNVLALGAIRHDPAITTHHPEANDAIAIAQNLHQHNRTLATLSMHGQRLSRQVHQTFRLLREIQAERRAAEEWQQKRATSQLTQHKKQPRPPADVSPAAPAMASFSRRRTFSHPTAPPPSDPFLLADSTLAEPLALAGLRPPTDIRTR